MQDQEYNGWTNRETWAMALWFDNEFSLYEMAQEYARTEIEGHDKDEEINPYYLAESLKNYIEEDFLTFENVSENQNLWVMLTDVGSLYRVNWREIAEGYLNEAKKEAVA